MNLLCFLLTLFLSLPSRSTAFLFGFGFEGTHTKEEASSAGAGVGAVVDCEVRTLVFDEGDSDQHFEQQRCVSYAANKDDASNEMVYDLPDWVVEKYKNDEEFEGQTGNFLRIHGGHFSPHSPTVKQQQLRSSSSSSYSNLRDNKDTVTTDQNALVEISDIPFVDPDPGSQRRRRAAQKSGISSVLVVRVSTNDATVDLDAATLSDRIFGPVGSPASQFKACSVGKKQLVAANGDGIIDGVLELSVNSNIEGVLASDFENIVNTALAPKVAKSLDSYDHIIYCLPPGSKGPPSNLNWKAFAYVNWNRAYFNNEKCGTLSHLVHELGHNMGLGHSGQGTRSYADRSGIMGYSYSDNQWPLMCFNAAKNWQLGWYSEKAIELSDRSTCGAWKGRLYGFPDFESIPDNDNSHVLIKVGDIHIQYNKIAEMNRDTPFKKNVVTITKSADVTAARSDALAGLKVGGAWKDEDLRVDVCSKHTDGAGLEYYDIVVRDHLQKLICDQDYTSQCDLLLPPSPALSPVQAQTHTTAAPSPALSEAPSTVAPTSLPSTIAPSASPESFMLAPRGPLICGDSLDETFPYVDENEVEYETNCSWLKSHPEVQGKICVEGHQAYSVCEETCGKCSVSCHDTSSTFVFMGAEKDCAWLSLNLDISEDFCKRSHDSYSTCPATCGGCNIPVYPVRLSLGGEIH